MTLCILASVMRCSFLGLFYFFLFFYLRWWTGEERTDKKEASSSPRLDERETTLFNREKDMFFWRTVGRRAGGARWYIVYIV